MKLLLDENLSRRLIPALNQRFPGSTQVSLLGLERSTDAQLCDFAAANDFVLVSKDDDFQGLVAARSYRPKLVREEVLHQPDVGIVVIDATAQSGMKP